MSKSPGHQQHPDHQVREERLDRHVQVSVNGIVIASSKDVILVDEDEHPQRFYFPQSDVQMECLEPTTTTSECPFKGRASYFNLKVGGQEFDDAVWTYADPFDEHRALRDRVAFYTDKFPEIQVEAGL